MKCFYHNAADAVAVCKNCSKGVCQDCASELVNGIACKDRCEAEVEMINNLIDRNKTTHQKTSSTHYRSALIFLLFGILFLSYGLMNISAYGSYGWFLVLTGILFLIGALIYFLTGKTYINKA